LNEEGLIMTRPLLLGAAVALVPIALQAATPPSQTSRGVSQSGSSSSSSSGNRSSGQSGSSGQTGRASSGAGLGGAPIPGLCMLSQTAVLSNAKVALAADARLKQLQQVVQNELQAEQTAINNDARTLEGQRNAPDFQARQTALQARANAFAQKSQLRQRELQATRQKALARISTEAQPVIAQAFSAHNCSLLLDRNSVLLGNMTNDITAEVARGLDAKISTITFERERLAK
jgi:Skp family chaperone for outer membrane proteins